MCPDSAIPDQLYEDMDEEAMITAVFLFCSSFPQGRLTSAIGRVSQALFTLKMT